MSRSVVRAFERAICRIVTYPLIVALLVVLVPFSGCTPKASTQSPVRGAQAVPKRVITASEKFAKANDKLTTSLEAASRAFKAGSTPTKALADIADFAGQLPALDRGMRTEFAKTRGILKKIDSAEKDAIERKVERQYAERLQTLERHLGKIEDARTPKETRKAVTACSEWLDSITPEQPHQPLGTELPHRIVDRKAGPPILGANIAPAYAPNTPGSEPSTLPVTPTSADLTQTVEVQFSPEISSLVTSLGADPVRIYEYVRNTIDFEPYYGSRKGATETLLEGSGNDMDTASLLIALMRKAGYPARYVSGVVDVPIDRAMNWVGVEKPEAAAKLFSAGGTPTKLVLAGGRPKTLQIEHTWAEVYVPYEDYRGAGDGTGPKKWVPLDGSWKAYRYTSPIDIVEESSVATWVFDSVDATAVASQYSRAFSEASHKIDELGPQATWGRVFGSKTIERSRPSLLPVVLPFSGVAAAEFNRIPRLDTWRIAIDLGADGGSPELSESLATLVGNRITLDFAPASEDDADLIERSGGLGAVSAPLAMMKPVVLVDGWVAAIGEPVSLGEAWQLSVSFVMPGGEVDRRVKTVIVGSTQSICVTAGRVAPGVLRDAAADVRHLSQAMSAQETTAFSTEQYVGGLLHGTVLSYFATTGALRRYTTFSANVVAHEEPSLAFCGMDVSPAYVYGSPMHLASVALSLDVKRDVFNCVERADDQSGRRAWMLLDGLLGSSGEHAVFEGFLGERALSAQRLLRLAREQGIPVRQLSGTAGLAAVDDLDLDTPVKDAIRSRIASGGSVVAPAREISVGDWTGAGWIELDGSGGSGFMISGGLAGGQGTDAGSGIRSTSPDGTPEPEPTAPGWGGGHPILLDYLYTAMLGKLVDYVPATKPDPRIPSGYRSISDGTRGQFVKHALGAQEWRYIAKLGALSAVAAGLWDAVWQVIDDTTGPNASLYLDQNLVVRRAALSFVVGTINGLLAFAASTAIAAADSRVKYAPLVTGLAVGVLVTTGWSNIKKQVFQALNMEPDLPGLRLPRMVDSDELPDLWDPIRSVETVQSPSYW